MSAAPQVHRLSAFTSDPAGGNPAGVVVTDDALDVEQMRQIATEVGYSETAFLVPRAAPAGNADAATHWDVRYFAPEMEVTFCGHATIASGVHLGMTGGLGVHVLHTSIGEVPVEVTRDGGLVTASLTSVEPSTEHASRELVDRVLHALGWVPSDLAPSHVPAIAYAGERHLVLIAATRRRLADLAYDYDRLRDVMQTHDLTTVLLGFETGEQADGAAVWDVRNPFPTGGVVEDPATGAAAAAFAGHLRLSGRVRPPTRLLLRQGDDMGRPSRLHITIPTSGGIVVAGTAVTIPG